MASISSLMGSSSSSSIYGNRNVISGLASGLDTEALIENAVSGYKSKITSLQQDKTSVEWKQEAYRSIISKLSGFLSKYNTFSTTDSLMSKSFFTNSIIAGTTGAHKDMVSAAGKSNSNIQLLGVKQVATAATYTVSGSALFDNMSAAKDLTTVTGEAVSLDKALNAGELVINLDGVTKTIAAPTTSGDADAYAAQLQESIDKAFGAGKLTVENVGQGGNLQLAFTNNQVGSSFTVAGKDSDASEALGLGKSGVSNYVDTSATLASLLGDEKEEYQLTIGSESFTFSKDATLSSVLKKINESDAGVTVNYSKTTNQFTFTAKETGAAGNIAISGDLFGGGKATQGQDAIFTMSVNGVMMENVTRSSNSFEVDGLTINLKGAFGYSDPVGKTLDNGKTIYEAMQPGIVTNIKGTEITATFVDAEGYYVSSEGGRYIMRNAAGEPILDENGKNQYFKGVAKSELAADSEPVTFTTSVDTTKIVDKIKEMVEDFNAIMTEVKKEYSTKPMTNSSGKPYRPLTEEDQADMSESAIKSHEEKAKTGLLFGDRDLSSLYQQMLTAVTSNVVKLDSIGITQSYVDGQTTLTVDEKKLTAALEKDVEGVAEIFTGSESGKGLMASLQTPLERYGKTTGANKGVLVEKAGSPLASATMQKNELYDKLQDLDDQIKRWQGIVSDKIDYYTSKFSYLEQLVAQMNNQSSMLMGLSGGY